MTRSNQTEWGKRCALLSKDIVAYWLGAWTLVAQSYLLSCVPSWNLHFRGETESNQTSVIMAYHNVLVMSVRRKIKDGKDMEGSAFI